MKLCREITHFNHEEIYTSYSINIAGTLATDIFIVGEGYERGLLVGRQFMFTYITGETRIW
jgi:hypothetical protein